MGKLVISRTQHRYTLSLTRVLESKGIDEVTNRAFHKLLDVPAGGFDAPDLDAYADSVIRLLLPVSVFSNNTLNISSFNLSSFLFDKFTQRTDLTEEIIFRLFTAYTKELDRHSRRNSLPSGWLSSKIHERTFHSMRLLAKNPLVSTALLGSFYRLIAWSSTGVAKRASGATGIDSSSLSFLPTKVDGEVFAHPNTPALVKAHLAHHYHGWAKPELFRELGDSIPELAGLPGDLMLDIAVTLPVPEEWLENVLPLSYPMRWVAPGVFAPDGKTPRA